MSLELGQALGRYRITAILGSGGMGEVYRAHDARLDREVAIKLLKETAGRDAVTALTAEARAISALGHPNVCTLHELDEVDGRTFLVMELVEGQTLASLIESRALSIDQSQRYALQIASALAHAHQRGVIHRDLKSANAIVTPEGVVKVLDFGLARRDGPAVAEEATRSVAPLESLGVIAGTLPYMAPETILGAPADRRSDVWSLGVVMTEMLTGRRPFAGQTAFDLTSAIVHAPPAAWPSQVPVGLKTIVERCLQKEPSARYQQASEVAAALDAVLGARSASSARRRRFAIAAVAAGVLALAALTAWVTWDRATDVATINALAVLPFEDLTPGPQSEYLADGITDAVITELGQLGALRVTSRTSSMRYRDSSKSMPEIGRELGVDAVLEGSIFRDAQRVRVTARLVRATTESSLWTGTYERELRDILALQRDLAQTVGRELRVSLTPDQTSELTRTQPVNPEAVEAYLKGRYQWAKRTPASLLSSIDLFEAAVRADPTYALPHAGLAGTFVLLGGISISERPSIESLERAKVESARALALDPRLAEAHTALAYALLWSWDFDASERAFQRAVSLNPNDATTRFWHAVGLAAVKRFDESIAEALRGQQLDPVSPIVTAGLSWTYHLAGRHAEAAEWARKVLEIEPDFVIGLSRLGVAYKSLGAYDRAIEVLQQAVALSGRLPDHLAHLGQTYALAGRISEAEGVIAELEEQSKTRHVPAFDRVLIYAGLGKRDAAFAWLQRAHEERYTALALLAVDPDVAGLRNDPRFAEFVRRVGLPSAR